MFNNDLSVLFISFYFVYDLILHLFFAKIFNYYKMILYFVILATR